MTAVLIFLTVVACGFVAAGIAHWKGRAPPTWLLYGVIGWIIAIPYLLMQTRRREGRKSTPLLYFVPAGVILAVVVLIVIYRLESASPI